LLLGFLVTFQIAKASEYVGILKGEKKTFEQNNRINGFLMIIFMVLGLIGVYWCNELYKGKMLQFPASQHGVKIDRMPRCCARCVQNRTAQSKILVNNATTAALVKPCGRSCEPRSLA
jgi:hypothetical protein